MGDFFVRQDKPCHHDLAVRLENQRSRVRAATREVGRDSPARTEARIETSVSVVPRQGKRIDVAGQPISRHNDLAVALDRNRRDRREEVRVGHVAGDHGTTTAEGGVEAPVGVVAGEREVFEYRLRGTAHDQFAIGLDCHGGGT